MGFMKTAKVVPF